MNSIMALKTQIVIAQRSAHYIVLISVFAAVLHSAVYLYTSCMPVSEVLCLTY